MVKTLYTGLTSPRADYVHTPLIEIAAVEDDTALRQAARHLADYDYLLFTSRYAVRAFLPFVRSTAAMPQFTKPNAGKERKTMAKSVGAMTTTVVAIGPTTAAALHEAGVADVQQAERDDSYGVIDWFSRQEHGRVLVPRSNLALPIIPDGLRRLGFKVDCVTAYVNRMPANPTKVDLSDIDRIVFTSPSTIDNFLTLYGSLPAGVEYVTRGAITQQHLEQVKSAPSNH